MKKLISTVLIIAAIACFATGCGGSKAKRNLYNVKLSKYVDLGDYKEIPVDTDADTFKDYEDSVIAEDVSINKLYSQKTEGTVADGDTVNIDYTGKKDGVAFEGGTDTGYDLEIGSNSFIEGFESGLVGVAVGSTKDLDITFPETYGNTDLAGKAVVFTVKVNYIRISKTPEEYYKDLKFDSIDEYNADVKKRASKNYLIDAVNKNSKINNYPEDDIAFLYDYSKTIIEKQIQSQYNIDFATYLSYTQQTEDDFKSSAIDQQVKPLMDDQMVLYTIFDKEKLSFTEEDKTAKINELVKQYDNVNITADTLKENYGDFYFEYLVVSDKVADYLYDNAKIS